MRKFQDIGCFSLHPLKNLKCMGDGGMMIAKTKILKKTQTSKKSRPCNRNEIKIFGINLRLDTIQAVANHLLKK